MQRLSAQHKLDILLALWNQKAFHDPLWGSLKSHRGMDAAEAGAQTHASAVLRASAPMRQPNTSWIKPLFTAAKRLGGPGSLAAAIAPAAGLAAVLIRSLLTNSRKDAALSTAQRLFQNHFQEASRQVRIESFAGGTFNPDLPGRLRAGELSSAFRASGSFTSGYQPLAASARPTPAVGDMAGAASAMSAANSQATPNAAPVFVLDAKSLADHGAEIANALRTQLQLGHPVADEIRQTVQMG